MPVTGGPERRVHLPGTPFDGPRHSYYEDSIKRHSSDSITFDPPLSPGKYLLWIEGSHPDCPTVKTTPVEVDATP